MEALSFDEIFELALETDVLVGVHGNGLGNMMFMKPKRYVVEIFPAIEHQFDYYYMARLMGHAHLCIYDGKPAHPTRWGMTYDNITKLWTGHTFQPKSATADLHDEAIVAIRRHVADAMELLPGPSSVKAASDGALAQWKQERQGPGSVFPSLGLMPVQTKLA